MTTVQATGGALAPGGATSSLGKEGKEMKPTKCDELTKALGTATSRRQALKAIAATTFGSILGLSGIGTAFGASKCHSNGLGCDTNSQCCSGYCQNGEKCTCPPAPACTVPPYHPSPSPPAPPPLNR